MVVAVWHGWERPWSGSRRSGRNRILSGCQGRSVPTLFLFLIFASLGLLAPDCPLLDKHFPCSCKGGRRQPLTCMLRPFSQLATGIPTGNGPAWCVTSSKPTIGLIGWDELVGQAWILYRVPQWRFHLNFTKWAFP